MPYINVKITKEHGGLSREQKAKLVKDLNLHKSGDLPPCGLHGFLAKIANQRHRRRPLTSAKAPISYRKAPESLV